MRVEIVLKKGIEIDGKEISLGQTIHQIRKHFPKYEKWGDMLLFFDGFLALTIGKGRVIEEIELRTSCDEHIVVMLDDFNMFAGEKAEVIHHLEKLNGDKLICEESSMVADSLGIRLTFGVTEEEIEDMIQSAKEDGVYEEMLEDINKDIYRSKHVETILLFDVKAH